MTAFDVQEHDHLKATDQSVTQLGKALDDVQKDRAKKHDESSEWKLRYEDLNRESRERLGRDEGIAIGALSLIGALHGVGLMRKYDAGDRKLKGEVE